MGKGRKASTQQVSIHERASGARSSPGKMVSINSCLTVALMQCMQEKVIAFLYAWCRCFWPLNMLMCVRSCHKQFSCVMCVCVFFPCVGGYFKEKKDKLIHPDGSVVTSAGSVFNHSLIR